MITPWNWPLNQICAKVAPALAAGNTMILKPSEEAPSCAMILADILHEAGVPAGVFNLVNGDGPTVGAALSTHPGVDMVSFTGSTRAGIAVAQAAAATVKRVHQELGGKAPNLVLEGADLASVLPPTLQGVLANSGQSCIAPTRLLVHDSQAEEAAQVAKAIFESVPVGDPAEMGAHIGPVVNKAQFDKIQALIQSAIDEGATLVTGRPRSSRWSQRGYYVRPTVFADVTPDMRIAREETFGPVATITRYTDRDEAVRLANATEYGLSAAISGDPAEAAKVAPRLRAGLVTINGWSGPVGTPFGGFKQSGNGREGGKIRHRRLHGAEDDRRRAGVTAHHHVIPRRRESRTADVASRAETVACLDPRLRGDDGPWGSPTASARTRSYASRPCRCCARGRSLRPTSNPASRSRRVTPRPSRRPHRQYAPGASATRAAASRGSNRAGCSRRAPARQAVVDVEQDRIIRPRPDRVGDIAHPHRHAGIVQPARGQVRHRPTRPGDNLRHSSARSHAHPAPMPPRPRAT